MATGARRGRGAVRKPLDRGVFLADYRELLADPSVDLVSITTHVDEHHDIAVEALGSGKHVFLEKPMAPTVEQCDRIVEAAATSDGLFMVGHICRFDPRAELQYFNDCVVAGRRPDRNTPEESREAVRLIVAATESSQSGKVVGF